MGWRDKVKNSRLPEDTVRIVLLGEKAAEHTRLVGEIEKARNTKASSLAGSGARALEEQLRAIEDEMAGDVVEFRLRALPRSKRPGDDRPSWAELWDDHPPRIVDGMMEPRDRLAGGVNYQTFPEPMVRASIVAIDGDESDKISDADWAELMASITDHQFDTLVNTAWSLNQAPVDVPFYSGDSQATRGSAPA